MNEQIIANSDGYCLRLGDGCLTVENSNKSVGPLMLAETTNYFEAPANPVGNQVESDGFAYRRDILSASIDLSNDCVTVIARVEAYGERYTPDNWEYSHKSIIRQVWSLSSGELIERTFED